MFTKYELVDALSLIYIINIHILLLMLQYFLACIDSYCDFTVDQYYHRDREK